MKKKKIFWIFIIMVGIISLVYGINYIFFSPTKINSFIASKIYKAPANKAFTDDNFYKCVVDAYNSKNRTSLAYTTNLSDEQLKTIERLSCSDKKVVSATGVEKLTNLTNLNADSNQLTELDVSKNTSLTYLRVAHNQLTALDVSKNTSLTGLHVDYNQLTGLDVSKNTALTGLSVYYNQLTELDVSKNTSLTELYVYHNQLTVLDVSGATALAELDVRVNQLTALDVSKNTSLTGLYVYDNQLTELDVSKNTALTGLSVYYNQLTKLDVSNNTALTELNAGGNQLTELDVSKNTALTELDASSNQLTELDVSKNTALTELDASSNQLTELDVSKNTALTKLSANSNQLTEIDVSKNTKLTLLFVSSNKLKYLNIINNPNISEISVSNNYISEFYINESAATNENLLGISSYEYSKVTHWPSGEQSVKRIPNIIKKMGIGTIQNIKTIEFNEKLNYYFNEKLLVLQKMDYDKLVNNISASGLNYKILDGDKEVNSGEIDHKKLLIYNGETLLDSVEIKIANTSDLPIKNADLYKEIIDEYNKENNAHISYIEKLTDEQFSKINYLNISCNNSKNTEGLEVLTGLKEIDVCFDDSLENFDISKLTNLEIITGSGDLETLKMSGNEKLKKVYLSGKIKNIDLSEAKNLEELELVYAVENLYLSKNKNLKSIILTKYNADKLNFDIFDNLETLGIVNELNYPGEEEYVEKFKFSINDININKNKKNIKNLYLLGLTDKTLSLEMYPNLKTFASENYLTSYLDLSKNVFLEYILSQYELDKVNLPKTNTLKSIDLSFTNIKNIDLSNYSNLEFLDLAGTNISSLDVSKNIKLKHLDLAKTNILTLDLKNNLDLEELSILGTHIKTIDLSNQGKIKNVQAGDLNLEKDIYIYNKSNIDFYRDQGLIKWKYNDDIVSHMKAKLITDSGSWDSIIGRMYWISSKNSKYVLSVDNIDNNIIKDSSITFNNPGKYVVSAKYAFDKFARANYSYLASSAQYMYNGTYNVYVVEAKSSKYEINEEKGYIYTGFDTNTKTILNNIELNYGNGSIENNKYIIKYNDEVIKEFDLVNISSKNYYLGNDYILTVNESFDADKINLINAIKELNNDILKIKYNDEVIREFNIYGINFGKLNISNKNILLTSPMSYNTFINNIITNGVTYKIFNNLDEITNGNVDVGMELKIYRDTELIDTFNITDEYLDLSLLDVDEDKHLIKNLVAGTTVCELKKKISTSGTITVIDINNNVLDDEKLVTSGSKLEIKLSKKTYEYILSVRGDVNGDGKVTAADVSKMYRFVKKKISISEECYLLAGDVNDDGKISTADVSKVYRFVKKRINSLD